MDALSNADRFVILLRQRLAERGRTKGIQTKRPAATERAIPLAPPDSVAQQVARAGADDATLRQAIVEQLITERLGALGTEARFQQVVQRVTEIISGDAELGKLLTEIAGGIRRR